MPRDIVRGPIGSLSGPVSFDSTQIILGNIGYYDDTVTKEWLEENIAEQTEWLLKKQGSHSFLHLHFSAVQTSTFAQIPFPIGSKLDHIHQGD